MGRHPCAINSLISNPKFDVNVLLVMAEIMERPSPGNKTDSAVSASNSASDPAILGGRKWMEVINAKQFR